MTSELPVAARAVFWTCKTYRKVAQDFHSCHQHDLNCALHLATSTMAVWGVVNVIQDLTGSGAGMMLIYTYIALVALTTPWKTALVHTALVYFCLHANRPFDVAGYYISGYFYAFEPWLVSFFAALAGVASQTGLHWLWGEPSFLSSYIQEGKAWMLIPHALWLLPLVIDAVLKRNCFLPYLPSRNRILVCTVASKEAVDSLRKWIQKKIKYSDEITRVQPRDRKGAIGPITELENDKSIKAALRTIFPAKHYDIRPVLEMNEICVAAVGGIRLAAANAETVPYIPHTEGPFWFFPGVSLYCMSIGLTPNRVVRQRFVLQHTSQDAILDKFGVIGFDYNRELQWIDHMPGKINIERRSVVRLHYIVYPTGWHSYGRLCTKIIRSYHSWSNDIMPKTVPGDKQFDSFVASCTLAAIRFNAVIEEHLGWNNLTYLAAAFVLGSCDFNSWTFLILTSFRHYCFYITTFAYRDPPVALGYLMRDAKLYKTISNIHCVRRLWPIVEFSRDLPGLLMVSACSAITLLACARLGMERTYFGTELGFVQPKWINGFPYGTIPHPMIMGQILGFGVVLYWWRTELTIQNAALLVAHTTCYVIHMLQEILTSTYKM